MPPDNTEYEFVVVGAGSAGCVVASRLAQAGCRTVLVEAGSTALTPIEDRPGLVVPERHPSRYWPPVVERADGSEHADSRFWMGRGLGGGSAVNGLLLSPGDGADYDRWATAGDCPDWDGASMTPWLDMAVATLDPEIVSVPAETLPVVEAFDQAFGELGLASAGSTLDGGRSGLFAPALAVWAGERRSVADAYLSSVKAGRDLTIQTGSTVEALAVEGRSVGGVVLTDGSTIRAPTVVLTAGTIGSARLLHGTGVVPSAGRWVRNHAAASLTVSWPARSDDRPVSPVAHRVARWCSEPGARQPDLSATLVGPFAGPSGRFGILLVMAATARSHGRIDFGSTEPVLITNRLADPEDVSLLRTGVRQAVATLGPLTQLRAVESSEGAAVGGAGGLGQLSNDGLDRWLRQHPAPVYHAVGSCRMGQTGVEGSVTDQAYGRAGRVRGLDGVVVADAAVLPDLVAGGLQLTVMAVAERIAAETLMSGDG